MKLLKKIGSLWFSIFYLELRKSISAMENLGGGQYWQIHLRIKMKTLFVFGQKKNHLWEIHFANCYLCHGERSRHLHGGRRCNAVLIRGGAGRFPPSNVLSTSKQGFPWPSTASSCSRVLGHVEEVLRYFFWIPDRKQRCLEVRWVSCSGLVAPPILWRSSESEDSAGLSPLWGESSSHPQSEPDSWQSNWDLTAVASTPSKAFPSLQTGRGQRVFWSLNRGPGLLGKVLYFCAGQWWIQWVVIESKWRKSRNPIKSLEDLIFSAGKSDQMKQQNQISWSNRGEVLWERERVLQILFETASGSWWSGQGPDKMITREHKLAKVSANLERTLRQGFGYFQLIMLLCIGSNIKVAFDSYLFVFRGRYHWFRWQ